MTQELEGTIKDLVADLLYYDRKEDEELPLGEIERLLGLGQIHIADIVAVFAKELNTKIYGS